MKTHLTITATTRADAVKTFRALPIKERRAAIAQHVGITWLDGHRWQHTMAFPVVEAEPRTRARS